MVDLSYAILVQGQGFWLLERLIERACLALVQKFGKWSRITVHKLRQHVLLHLIFQVLEDLFALRGTLIVLIFHLSQVFVSCN